MLIRETLLGQLTIYITQTRDNFIQKTGGGGKGVPKGKNMPETVNNIVWVRQLEAKVITDFISFDVLIYFRFNPLDARSRYTGSTVYQRHRQKPVYRRHGYQRHRPEAILAAQLSTPQARSRYTGFVF